MVSRYADPQMAAARAAVGKHDAAPEFRLIRNGAIELVWVRRGRLHGCTIERDGTVHGAYAEPRSRRWILARAGLVGSLLAFVASGFVAPWILGQSNRWVLLAVGAMVVLTWVAGALDDRETRRALRDRPRREGWVPVRSLGRKDGSPPLTWLTLPGLVTIEELATERGDLALLHRRPDGSVEVVTEADGRVERHAVDPGGRLSLIDSAGTAHRLGFGRTLESRARRLYGGRRSDWDAVDFRPTD